MGSSYKFAAVAYPAAEHTVHETESLTFFVEFRGCSAQTPADSCAE